jgi:hypothetical protein
VMPNLPSDAPTPRIKSVLLTVPLIPKPAINMSSRAPTSANVDRFTNRGESGAVDSS